MSLVAFDLETHLIQPGLLAPPIVCGSFAGGPYGKGELCDKLTTLARVDALLDDPEVIWCGANLSYDWGCVLAVHPEWLPRIWSAYAENRVLDVLIGASLNAIAEGRMRDSELFRRDGSIIQSGRYSLAECVSEWLLRDDAKANDRWRKSYALLESVPLDQWPNDARQYPVDDALNTLLVAETQVQNAKNMHDMAVQAHAAFCMHLGSIWGLRTDDVAVEKLAASIDEKLSGLRTFAHESGFFRAKVKKRPEELSKDTKAIKEAVFKAYNGNPPTTEGGQVSYSRTALEDSGDPVLKKLAAVSKWEKLQTYIPTLREAARVPLNISANVVLSTGRTSYDGLIQLIPRKGGVRECFRARPGTVWSSVDYAAIEMSTLAQVCLWTLGFSKLAEAINAGQDPHGILAADLMNTSYESFMAQYKAKVDGTKDMRQAGKAANFGFPGMMGGPKFVIAKRREGDHPCEWFYRDGKCGQERTMEWRGRPLEMPLCVRCIESALMLRERYLARWEEIQPYWDKVTEMLDEHDGIEQFISKRFRGQPHAPAAANTLFQGLAADGAKRAVIKMTNEMYLDRQSPLYGSRLVLFSHDETMLEIPEERAHEAAVRQAEIMVSEMKKLVPDVTVKAEPALQYIWSKQAEAVYNSEGRLIPWQPEPARMDTK